MLSYSRSVIVTTCGVAEIETLDLFGQPALVLDVQSWTFEELLGELEGALWRVLCCQEAVRDLLNQHLMVLEAVEKFSFCRDGCEGCSQALVNFERLLEPLEARIYSVLKELDFCRSFLKLHRILLDLAAA